MARGGLSLLQSSEPRSAGVELPAINWNWKGQGGPFYYRFIHNALCSHPVWTKFVNTANSMSPGSQSSVLFLTGITRDLLNFRKPGTTSSLSTKGIFQQWLEAVRGLGILLCTCSNSYWSLSQEKYSQVWACDRFLLGFLARDTWLKPFIAP